MALRLLRFVVAPLLAIPVVLRGQAAVEYALKSAGSAMAPSGGSAIAGCKVDSTLLSCLGHSYPRTTILIGVVIGLLILRWLARPRGYGAY
jgi:lambda repressor-like predicted transcriptional regulator